MNACPACGQPLDPQRTISGDDRCPKCGLALISTSSAAAPTVPQPTVPQPTLTDAKATVAGGVASAANPTVVWDAAQTISQSTVAWGAPHDTSQPTPQSPSEGTLVYSPHATLPNSGSNATIGTEMGISQQGDDFALEGDDLEISDPKGSQGPTYRGATIAHDDAGTRANIPAGATAYTTLKGSRGASDITVAHPSPRVVARPNDMTTLGADYSILERVGEGGMGTVYRARQTSIQRDVAVKEIKPALAKHARHCTSFSAEAAITGALDHPNIVPIYELGTTSDGNLFYSMKLVKGRPWVDTFRSADLADNVETLLRVCDAIAFAHSRQVMHRDLKPENVMLGDFGEVLVMDWGLGAHLHPEHQYSPGGSPAYMAPEMAQHYLFVADLEDTPPSHPIGLHSDIYLLGAILFEMISGLPPHASQTPILGLKRAAENQIVEYAGSGELYSIAMKALATDPHARYGSVQELQQALRHYQRHTQSILLSERSAQYLAEARAAGDYHRYSQALHGFTDALELWDGNQAARAGIVEARHAYAQQALSQGDFELGLSLLQADSQEDQPLYQTLTAQRAERNKRVRMHQRLTRLALGLLIAIVIGSGTAAWWFNRLKSMAEVARKEADSAREVAEQERQTAVEAQRREATERMAAQAAQQAEAEARVLEAAARQRAQASQRQAEQAEQEERRARQVAASQHYRASIGLAASLLKEQAYPRAAAALRDLSQTDLEGDFLRHQIQRRQQTILPEQAPFAQIQAVASQGGLSWVTAEGNDHARIRIWQLPPPGHDPILRLATPLREFEQHGRCLALALSPSGLLAIACDHQPGFTVWDLARQQSWQSDAVGRVTALQFLDDAHLQVGLLRPDGGAFVEYWDAQVDQDDPATGQPRTGQPRTGQPRTGQPVTWNRSQHFAHNTRPIRLLSARGPYQLSLSDYFLTLAETNSSSSMQLARYSLTDGQPATSWLTAATLLNTDQGKAMALLGTNQGHLALMALERTGDFSLRIAPGDGMPSELVAAPAAETPGVQTTRAQRSLQLPRAISTLALHPREELVAVGQQDGFITFVNHQLEERQTLRPHLEPILYCAFVPTNSVDGTNRLQSSQSSAWRLLTVTQSEVAIIDPHLTNPRDVPAVSPDLQVVSPYGLAVRDARLSASGEHVAAVDQGGNLLVWNLSQPTASPVYEASVGHLADTGEQRVMPRAAFLNHLSPPAVLTSMGHSLCLWNANTGALRARWRDPDGENVVWSLDAEQNIWIAPRNQRGLILDAATLRPRAEFTCDAHVGPQNRDLQWWQGDDSIPHLLIPMNASLRLLSSANGVDFTTTSRLQDQGFRSASRSVRHVFAHPQVGLSQVAVCNGEETIVWDLARNESADVEGETRPHWSDQLRGNLSAESVASEDHLHARWIARVENAAARPAVQFRLLEFSDRATSAPAWQLREVPPSIQSASAAMLAADGNTLWVLTPPQGDRQGTDATVNVGEGMVLQAFDLTSGDVSAAPTVYSCQGLPSFGSGATGYWRLTRAMSDDPALPFLCTLLREATDMRGIPYHAGDTWLMRREAGSNQYDVASSFLSRQPLTACQWHDDAVLTLGRMGDLRVWHLHQPRSETEPASVVPFTDQVFPWKGPGRYSSTWSLALFAAPKVTAPTDEPGTPWSPSTLHAADQESAQWLSGLISPLQDVPPIDQLDPADVVACSPSQRRLARYDSATQRIQVYDIAQPGSWDLQKPIAEQSTVARVTALAFSPSGKRLLIGFGDGRIAIYRLEIESSRQADSANSAQQEREGMDELFSFEAHRDAIRSLQVWNGSHLISTGDDGEVRFWDIRPR